MTTWVGQAVHAAPRCEHGEGPVWDDARQRLGWVDLNRGIVHRASVDASGVQHQESIEIGGTVGAVLPSASGDVLIADDGYSLLAEDGTVSRLLDLPTERRGETRMNDGACDAAGRLWAGTMAFDARTGGGNLYRTDLDGATHLVVPGVTISNGIGWSPDGATMYYADSGPRTIWAWQYDAATGELGVRSAFVVADEGMAPDGLAVDVEGCVWVAMWGGSAVHRYAPDGALIGEVQVPVSQPSSCAFAGRERTTLVISTSQAGLDAAALQGEPDAGLLFTADVGVAGIPTPLFRGPASGWSFAAPTAG